MFPLSGRDNGSVHKLTLLARTCITCSRDCTRNCMRNIAHDYNKSNKPQKTLAKNTKYVMLCKYFWNLFQKSMRS
jgi:thymidine kinase